MISAQEIEKFREKSVPKQDLSEEYLLLAMQQSYLQPIYCKISDDLTICLVGSNFYLNRERLDLSAKPLMLKVIQAFMQTPSKRLSRDHVIFFLYGENPISDCRSIHYWKCRGDAVVKQLQRTRQLFHETFDHLASQLEWFPFEKRVNQWNLVRISRHPAVMDLHNALTDLPSFDGH